MSKKSAIGAPSQYTQSSRKGKKAWRKHVDIADVEQALEEQRAEERVIGTALNKLKDEDLFFSDIKGDEKVRKRFSTSQLTAAKILAQRSAVPAVFSRNSSSETASGKRKLGHEEKERLRRIAKRPKKGPFNSIMDPSEYGAGSAVVELSEAVKKSGSYDPWAAPKAEEELKDGLENVVKKQPKAPVTATQQTRHFIEVPAVLEPHQGTSYNPPVQAHQDLIMKAATIEKKKVEELERMAEVKKKMESARHAKDEAEDTAAGMRIQEVDEDTEEEKSNGDRAEPKRVPERKTKSQRNKMARMLAEKRALALRAEKKRLHVSINEAKGFRRSTARLTFAKEKEREAKLQAQLEKLKKQGLAGQKLGKYKVPEGRIEVQLGEDLSESLRALKPEGSLFHDRFQSLQQRALIEPRVPVLPKRRRHRIVEYEKQAWKKFDRD